MTPRDRVIRALNHQSIDRAPRDLWLAPGMEKDHADDVAEMNVRFPSDIQHLDTKWPTGKRTKMPAGKTGHFVDAWGCTWQLEHRGTPSALVQAPLADAAAVDDYHLPSELLEAGRFSKVNRWCEGASRFMLAWSDVRPLDRLHFLRGIEPATIELNAGNRELRGLLTKLHDHFLQECRRWAATEVDGVVLADDLGWPGTPRITPKTWRSLFKPLYKEYCQILHDRDKFVFFQSDGQLADVMEDLVEVGIDAIQSQLFRMDFEKLAEQHRGRITFWGEIDRKKVEPPATARETREAVLRVRKALDFGAGGVIAQCRWNFRMPIQSVAAYFEEWMVPLPVAI